MKYYFLSIFLLYLLLMVFANKKESFMEKGLYLVSTPIGNLGDMTSRGQQILEQASVIACEDTRTTQKLLSLLGISTHAKMVAYHEYNADKMRPLILNYLADEKSVVLVSDAGTPLLSDPGYRLVKDCLDNHFSVFPIPGANALLPALQLSGLPCDRFFFMGFLSPKKTARKKELLKIASIPATLIFYESPHRLQDALQDMLECLGDRNAAVVRELTKKFEESKRGLLSELCLAFPQEPRGEIVIVIDRPPALHQEFDIDALLRQKLATSTLKEAVTVVALQTGIHKKDVYKKALSVKNEK